MKTRIAHDTRQFFVLGMLVGVCFGILGACQPNSEDVNDNARSMVVEWCRLAEFPSGRTNEKIAVAGSAFSREFEVWFTLDPGDLEKWIKDSPGLQDADLQTHGDLTTYLIQPKDAAYGMVRINKATGEVYIKTYWS